MGFGTLGTVAGLRWLVGNWEKGRLRWWEDWRRVSDGLERDLKVRPVPLLVSPFTHGITKKTLTLTVQEKVTAIPTEAAMELEKSLTRRWDDIKDMKIELESLQSDSDPRYRRDLP